MAAAKSSELLTLTEVSKKTGISMPTLQRYKKLYQSRIPSQGKGRTQRYKPEAVAVFEKLKEENIKKRGRPRKATSPAAAPKKVGRPKKTVAKAKKTTRRAPARRKAGKAASAPAPKKKAAAGLLTLTEIGQRTGISYPTLLRYVRNHLPKLPHQGAGRARRFLPEAVEIFQAIRGESRGGRRRTKPVAPRAAAPAAGSSDRGLASRIRALESSHKALIRMVERLEKAVKAPVKVTLGR